MLLLKFPQSRVNLKRPCKIRLPQLSTILRDFSTIGKWSIEQNKKFVYKKWNGGVACHLPKVQVIFAIKRPPMLSWLLIARIFHVIACMISITTQINICYKGYIIVRINKYVNHCTQGVRELRIMIVCHWVSDLLRRLPASKAVEYTMIQ